MKKIFAMSLVVLSLCFATSVQAQVKFGLKGGLNITNMSFNKDVFNTSNHTGFYIGPTAKFSLPIGFGVDAAALYDQRQAKLDDAQTIKQQSINIPINLRYNIGLGSWHRCIWLPGHSWGSMWATMISNGMAKKRIPIHFNSRNRISVSISAQEFRS